MSTQQATQDIAPGMTIDRLFRILEGVHSHIRAFDTKAQIVMAGNGVLAAAYSVIAPRYVKVLITQSQWGPRNTLVLLMAGVGLTVFLVSVIAAFLTLSPRTELKQPHSMLFFGHLARQYGTDYERCFGEISSASEGELRRDVVNQILVNSNICDKKCSHAGLALQFLFASFACWILLFLMTLPEAA